MTSTSSSLRRKSDVSPPPAKRARLSLEGGAHQASPKNSHPVQENHIKSEFPLRNLEEFYKTCPTYRLPVEVGSFSLDNKGRHQLDRSQLKYYSQPFPYSRLNFDLKVGYDKYVPINRSVPTDKLNPILRWIAVNGDCFRPKMFSPKSPDKTSRGNEGVMGGGAGGVASGMGRRVSVGEVVTTTDLKDRCVPN